MQRELREAGICLAFIPERAPNVMAYTERFVRSIKEECLDRLIPIGDRVVFHGSADIVRQHDGRSGA